jgi:TonB family protein
VLGACAEVSVKSRYTLRVRFPLALLFFCGSAFSQQQAQTPLPEGVYRPGKGVTSPERVNRADPQYSEEARIARLTGTFMVSFIVGEDGKVRDVHADASPGLGLGEKAIEAVSSWRFKPGEKDGVPVSVAMEAEMNFRLSVGRGEWSLSRALFDLPEGTTRPRLTAAPYPSTYAATSPNGSVTISFDVDPKGVTANLHIEAFSNPALESEAISIVRGWRFQPGARNGEPASVRCTMEFVKGNGNTHP